MLKQRAVLLPINNKCSMSKTCKVCERLGYREAVPNAPEIIKLYSNNFFVLPCSSVESSRYGSTISMLDQNKCGFAHIFTYDYFKTNPVKSITSPRKVAIIFTKFSDLKYKSSEFENYFMLEDSHLNLDGFDIENPECLKEVNFFYVPANSSDYKSTEKYFSLAHMLKEKFPWINFSLPYGHDLLDSRNPQHLQWQLLPSKKHVYNVSEEKQFEISIVLPFYNRTELLIRVIRQLARQDIAQNKFEVLLIDDGSHLKNRRKLLAFLRTIENIQITYLYCVRKNFDFQFDIGNRAGPARNLGAQLSKGLILLFLDSDILLPSDYLSKISHSHSECDIILPRRIYLNEETTKEEIIDLTHISSKNIFTPHWLDYINAFYERNNWPLEKLPWKYSITYCLSMKKELFFKSGGFRTNYISFGYEDLDLGVRLVQMTKSLQLINIDVFHLYHFSKGSEYTLDPNDRQRQLAKTSKTFLLQNTPIGAEYLYKMIQNEQSFTDSKSQLLRITWRIIYYFNKMKVNFRMAITKE